MLRLQEADPLDAFMAEINQEVTADKPSQQKPARELELDEEDHVADFFEVMQSVQAGDVMDAACLQVHLRLTQSSAATGQAADQSISGRCSGCEWSCCWQRR